MSVLMIDRNKLVAFLDQLAEPELRQVVVQLGNQKDFDRLPVHYQGQSLVAFAESKKGPGLPALAEIVTQLFPDTNTQWDEDSISSISSRAQFDTVNAERLELTYNLFHRNQPLTDQEKQRLDRLEKLIDDYLDRNYPYSSNQD